jgi:hypothetical protein
MAKWPISWFVTIEGVKVGQSYSKAYGTTCRRQKYTTGPQQLHAAAAALFVYFLTAGLTGFAVRDNLF